MVFSESDILCYYSSLTIGKDHPDYELMCVYEELSRENYQIIAKAQKNIGEGMKVKEYIRSRAFWNDVLEHLNNDLTQSKIMGLPAKTSDSISYHIGMVTNILPKLLL